MSDLTTLPHSGRVCPTMSDLSCSVPVCPILSPFSLFTPFAHASPRIACYEQVCEFRKVAKPPHASPFLRRSYESSQEVDLEHLFCDVVHTDKRTKASTHGTKVPLGCP